MIAFFIFIFGLIIGSFLNVCIWRLHENMPLVWSRSICPKCRQELLPKDLIPLLSFLLSRGKCRYCGKKISWQYPIIELTTGVLFVCSYLYLGHYGLDSRSWVLQSIVNDEIISALELIRYWFVIAAMIVIFVYDLKYYLILDKITLPSVAVMLVLNIILGYSWWSLIIAGLIGAGFFLIQILISRGKWVGGGDVRLGLLIGIIFGFPQVLLGLFIAYVTGAIVGVGLILFSGKNWKSQIPFGTFLSLATVVVLFYGEIILKWYLSLVGRW